jgi:hypothetical protein
MILGIIHVYDMSFDFQLSNVFYCFILIMVHGDLLRVLEAAT